MVMVIYLFFIEKERCPLQKCAHSKKARSMWYGLTRYRQGCKEPNLRSSGALKMLPYARKSPVPYLSTAKAQKKGCKLGENTQFALPIQESCVAKPSRVLVWPTQGCKKFPISLGNEVILCRLEQALQTCESVFRTGCRVRLGLAARVS